MILGFTTAIVLIPPRIRVSDIIGKSIGFLVLDIRLIMYITNTTIASNRLVYANVFLDTKTLTPNRCLLLSLIITS